MTIAFDFDDTLVFSSGAFEEAVKLGFERGSPAYWEQINRGCGRWCEIKALSAEIVEMHRLRGDKLYVVTARDPDGGDALRLFIHEEFGIEPGHVYFEPDGKAECLRKLGVDVFYGDSDSDIADASSAGAIPVRILRSAESTYRRKYNPGSFGELVIEGSDGS